MEHIITQIQAIAEGEDLSADKQSLLEKTLAEIRALGEIANEYLERCAEQAARIDSMEGFLRGSVDERCQKLRDLQARDRAITEENIALVERNRRLEQENQQLRRTLEKAHQSFLDAQQHHTATSFPLVVERFGSREKAAEFGRKLWKEDVPSLVSSISSLLNIETQKVAA